MADLDPTDYNGQPMIIVSVLFLAVTYLSIALRVVVRVFILKTFSVDDWLMVLAQITFTLSSSFMFVGVHWGMGRHNLALSIPARIQALKYQTLVATIYVGTMMLIKLSIAVFLLRIATKKRYIVTLKISMGVIAIWSVATILFNIFQCTPVQSQWDFTIVDFHCAPGNDFVNAAYAISAMTVISDWLYALIPIPMIWSVQMTMQKKLTVALVLSMGVFASIATLIRIKYLVALGSYEDNLYTATPALVWTVVEPGVAITAASLITIRPLLRALHISGFGSGSTLGRSRSHSNPNQLNAHGHPLTGSQTLHSRTRGMNGVGGNEGREGFQLKSWNNIEGGKKGGGKGLVRTDTTAVSENGSQEFILQRQATRDEDAIERGYERDRDGEPGAGEIRRTVVVKIKSSPGVMVER